MTDKSGRSSNSEVRRLSMVADTSPRALDANYALQKREKFPSLSTVEGIAAACGKACSCPFFTRGAQGETPEAGCTAAFTPAPSLPVPDGKGALLPHGAVRYCRRSVTC